ncbi:nucleoside-diphosphate sugar epimerase/dehydratase [Paenibacillus hodogayensis]|uniref:Nucleoside-diphosphate sugar epimerase/dehydratase n=1 Tax=Paenibacillus hodogayensis TaxID=279208 RepID=A0ABV5W8Y8_9BACL
MSYNNKRLSGLIGIDMLIVSFGVYAAYVLHYGGVVIIPEQLGDWGVYTGISVAVCTIGMITFKLYNRIWHYASIGELLSIVKAVTVTCLISWILTSAVIGHLVPIPLLVRSFETILLLMGGTRFAWRVFRDSYFKSSDRPNRALIIGAGDCGTLIAKEMKCDKSSLMTPVAFIDDDIRKHHLQVLGLPVYGGRDKISEAVERLNIDEIIIALPSVLKKDISQIISHCKSTKAKLKIIPKIGDLIQGIVTINEIRDVEVEDLLGREPVNIDLQGIADYVSEKIVLVTGAGGSIGSELCRQLAPFKPIRLIMLGHGENSIYSIEAEIRRKYPELIIESVIADIQDRARIEFVFAKYSPQLVFHAAAHKHVPLMEHNPSEAVKNNIFGTKNVADCADRFGVERFVFISTDKAVNPTSVMGTTKRVGEMYIQSLNAHSVTRFVAVRFGNVLGSRGSVIPKFKEQIRMGGPVTVTHPEMIRYFMTIPEAVQLVIQAGAIANGGEVFVLDMGEPVKILDLAKDLIRLSGFEPGLDIEISYSGVRPGEKLFEELLTDEEGLASTKHNRIFIGKPVVIARANLEFQLSMLEKELSKNEREIKRALKQTVPTYQYTEQEQQMVLV